MLVSGVDLGYILHFTCDKATNDICILELGITLIMVSCGKLFARNGGGGEEG